MLVQELNPTQQIVKFDTSAGAYGEYNGWCWSLRPSPFLKRYIGHVCKSVYSAENYWDTRRAVWFRAELFKKGKMLPLTTLNKRLRSPVVQIAVILPVIFCCDKGEGGEESEQRRQFSVEEEQSQEAAGKHTYTSVWMHTCLLPHKWKYSPPPAPDAAVCSTDAEKEEDESSTPTAAEESSVKVALVLITLRRQHEQHAGPFLPLSIF